MSLRWIKGSLSLAHQGQQNHSTRFSLKQNYTNHFKRVMPKPQHSEKVKKKKAYDYGQDNGYIFSDNWGVSKRREANIKKRKVK